MMVPMARVMEIYAGLLLKIRKMRDKDCFHLVFLRPPTGAMPVGELNQK